MGFGVFDKYIDLKHGSTRLVLLVGNVAIKLPNLVEWRLFLHGLLANMQEARLSKTGWPELCQVLWSTPGGLCVIMKRALPCPRETFYQLDVGVWKNRDSYVVPVEDKLDSFGVLNGKLVVVDYGN